MSTATAELLALAAVERGAGQHAGELEKLVGFLQRLPRPRNVLELGVMHGGTLWLWRQLAALEGHALGVDVAPPRCEPCERREAHDGCTRERYIENIAGEPGCTGAILTADTHAWETFRKVQDFFPDGVDLLHIDADHTREGCWRDFELYSPLVVEHGVLVVHDVGYEHDGNPVLTAGKLVDADVWGPAMLWETLRSYPGAFTIAREEGGFGIGVIRGAEWRRALYEG